MEKFYYKSKDSKTLYCVKEQKNDENLIEIAEEQFNALSYAEKPQKTEQTIQILSIRKQIGKLKSCLRNTDYQPLKYLDGEYTEEEYAVLKAQRQAWREEIRELEKNLN